MVSTLANELVPLGKSSVGSSLQAAAEATAEFIAASRSAATRRAYAADWRSFEQWCSPERLITLPAQPNVVAAYLASMATADPPAKVSTIRRRMCAIGHFHSVAGVENPCGHAGVKATLAGIARTLSAAPEKKTALTPDDLTRALKKIPQDLVGLRDRALILIGFAAALRRSELVALDVTDIERHAKGIVLSIRRSKTDQQGAGLRKAVPHGRKLKPVAALDAWFGASGITSGPVFRGVRGATVLPGRLDPGTVARVLKRRVGAIGLDADMFAAHSMRSGFISTAAEHGAALADIARHAGHSRLDSTMGYIQVANAFARHSGKDFL